MRSSWCSPAKAPAGPGGRQCGARGGATCTELATPAWRRDETWRPLARKLAAWHDDAARVRAQAPHLTALQQAEDWLKAAARELRNQRLAPFAAESQQVWRQLRQQSNVELGAVRLREPAPGGEP